MNPNILDSVIRLSENASDANDFIEDFVKENYEKREISGNADY